MLKELFNGSVILAGVGAAMVIATSSQHSPSFLRDVITSASIVHVSSENDVAKYPMTFGKIKEPVEMAFPAFYINAAADAPSLPYFSIMVR